MHNNIFETFLKICGTERIAATLLGITQPHISQIRNGLRSLNFEKACLITDYLKEKINIDVNPIDMISTNKKNKFILSKNSLFSNIPITYGKIDLRKIIINKKNGLKKSKEKKLIIIDEFNFLISGDETYFTYLNSNKKIVEGYKFHLQKLVDRGLDKSCIKYITKEFDLIERTKLAQRVKYLSGDRRENLFKKDAKVDNYPHIALPSGSKTRDFVAQLFGLGSAFSYRMLKRIISYRDEHLIEKVRQGEITPHAAYRSILNTKSKPSFSFRSLFNR